jgi:hypothetical protein
MNGDIEWNDWDNNTPVANNLSELVGETIATVTGGETGSDEMVVTTTSGKAIKVYHQQSCCESVSIEDADLDDVVGGVVLFAGFVEGVAPTVDDEYAESYTWSFLKIDTSKGSIWQRWYGSSNGYYSESVDVEGGVVRGSPLENRHD